MTTEKDIQIKVSEHTRALRDQFWKIKVQVLKAGDEFTTITGDGPVTTKVEADGKLPFKKNHTDAGFDLFTPIDVSIKYGEIVKIPLNIRMELPTGSWARIETKSGLGSKGMLVYAGVVDQGYRGIPHVIATNLCKDTVIDIKAGSKVAQMTMNPHSLEFFIEEVAEVDTATERGVGGFGSTGAQ